MTYRLTIKERIESHIISKDNCWITDYNLDSTGRPRIAINEKNCILARVVCEIYKDSFTKDHVVCHSCNNLLCINPDHLYHGKNKRNQTISSSKSGPKLNEAGVRQIRNLLIEGQLKIKQIADMFDVSSPMIRVINNGKAWTRVEGIGSKIRTRRKSNGKLNEAQVIEIRDFLIKGILTFNQIGEIFGVSHVTIRRIDKGETWTHVEGIGSKIRTKK